jgi:hypothetical protein
MSVSDYAKNKWLWLGGTLCFIFVGLCIPLHIIPIVREFQLLIIDEQGYALQGINASQNWGHYKYGIEESQEFKSDENGRVILPTRVAKISTLRRFVYPIWNAINWGVHASWEAHESHHTDENRTAGQRVGTMPASVLPNDCVYQRIDIYNSSKRSNWGNC